MVNLASYASFFRFCFGGEREELVVKDEVNFSEQVDDYFIFIIISSNFFILSE